MSKPEKTGFDLSKIDVVNAANQGAEVEIMHPVSGVSLGITIRVAGTDSVTHRNAQREITNRRLRNKQKNTITVEAIEEEALSVLAKCTLGWSGLEDGGKPLEFNEANARMIYEKYPFVKEQVETFMLERGNFLRD